MSRVAVWVGVGLLQVLALGAPAASQTFVFHLSSDQEVPPFASSLTGGCMGVLDEPAAELAITCVHEVPVATTMHIHRAPAGTNGPVVFDLGSPASPVTASWTGMSAADIIDLLAGDLYVNIHDGGRPSGAVRGQILERTVDAVDFALDGAQQVPPDVSGTTGSCSADLNDAATELFVECTHDVADPTIAHVHQAPPGENGPVVFDFPSAGSPFSANAPVTPEEVAAFAAALLYVNVHSTDSPGGEIRGQIGAPPAGPTTGTIRIVKRTFPTGGVGFGFTDDVPGSPGFFSLDDGGVATFSGVAPGSYTVEENDPAIAPGGFALTHVECADADSSGNRFSRTAAITLAAGETVTCTFENGQAGIGGQIFVFDLAGAQEVPPVASAARGGCFARFDAGAAELSLVCTHDVVEAGLMHVHRGAPGVNGPVVFDLGNPASPAQANWTGMSAGDVADLLSGNLYVNIHTDGRPAGEIRGQILERTVDTIAFPLETSQQVPPALSGALGRCQADLGDNAVNLLVECIHDVVAPTVAHVHNAPAGTNGPVVFTFPDAATPFSATFGLSPRDVADYAAGFFYVNVHSLESPDGEVRGQMIDQGISILAIPALDRWGAALLILLLVGVGAAKLAAPR